MSARRPLISAWVGHGNFGDELLGYGLRLELYKLASIDQIYYHEAGACPIFRAEDDAPINALLDARHGRLRRLTTNLGIARSAYDIMLFGGGSVLHSEHSIHWKHLLLKRFRRSKNGRGGIAAGVGLSLGPYKTRAAVEATKRFVADLDFLICRDVSSSEFARGLGTNTTVVEGRDLAFGVKKQHPEWFLPLAPPSQIGLCFILDPKLSPDHQDRRLATMQAIVDHLTESGRKVVLIALYTGGKYADDRLADRLRAAARTPDLVAVHHYRDDIASTTRCIASCSHIVSVRLHGLVTAYLAGVPAIPLNRHPKVAEFSKEAGLLGTSDAVDLDSPIEDIFANLDAALAQPSTTQCITETDARYLNSLSILRNSLS